MTDRFTVYDIFAVLVPGVLVSALLVVTARRLAGIEILDWTGGAGDAALLVIAGYAVGSLLQALGDLVVDPLWLKLRGGQPTATLLLPDSDGLSDGMKEEILAALAVRYGTLPPPDPTGTYRQRLEEVTYRALKHERAKDPLTDRFQAEHHQMRAAAVGFAALAVLAASGPLLDSPTSWGANGGVAAIYALLCALALWRMEDKAVHFAKHVLTCFANIHDSDEGRTTRNARRRRNAR
jgi:hypothetical protein